MDMTSVDSSENQQTIIIYGEVRKDLLARQLSNSVNYDNAILTLSSAALGLSLTFIKNIVPIEKIDLLFCLFISWGLFGAAIISTIISYLVSQRAINIQLDHAYKYYIEGNDEFLNAENTCAKWTDCLNLCSGLFFIFAVVITISFVAINIGEIRMKNEDRSGKKVPTPKVESTESIKKGANIPTLQAIPKKKNLTNSEQSREAEPNQSNQKK